MNYFINWYSNDQNLILNEEGEVDNFCTQPRKYFMIYGSCGRNSEIILLTWTKIIKKQKKVKSWAIAASLIFFASSIFFYLS